ncbi:terpenoid synthase [Pleurotus eryngii]|uniref:Terpene synthase n=1 Tax=Pleurotus eryngii TaxID=5323 RepID=A0A9P5ZM34_PLEER|nr:terpenoid synthase [Pleurotus eryngii]
MSSQPTQIVLPDLLAMCPLKGYTNPHYKEAAAESVAWIDSYNVFTDRKRAFFVQGCNELLVSHTFPYAPYEQFRTCCDLVNLLFVIDEVSDDQSGKDARATGQVFLNALGDPEWNDGSLLSRITKDFRARYFRLAGPNSSRRFLKHCEDYINAVSTEAELRERGEVLDIEPFTALRRENSAIRLCFGLFEYALGIDLPDEVFQDKTFQDMYFAAVDMVSWSNDVYSYNMEQAKGHSGNNIVTVLMKSKAMGIQEAVDHVGVHFQQIMDIYMESKSRLPSWGPEVDANIARYVEALGHWAKGNLDWSFETQRYFGAEHLEVMATRVVTLRPHGSPEDFDE